MSILKNRSSVLCFTGHRPDKLGGYGERGRAMNTKVADAIAQELGDLRTTIPDLVVITGMAQGVDQIGAMVAQNMDIPVVAAIPCAGQEKPWPAEAQRLYQTILERCEEVYLLSDSYSVAAMQDRNIWMVDHSAFVLGVHDGSTGGTNNCLRYASRAEHKPIVRIINPKKL